VRFREVVEFEAVVPGDIYALAPKDTQHRFCELECNRSLALELAERDSLLGWMYQREGDNMKASECVQKALKHPIHEVQRLAIA